MLPTRPRPVRRSTCSSCATPCWITATRVSCGLTLIRISSLTAGMGQWRSAAEFRQQLVSFVQRQTHYTGVAAVDRPNEHGAAALNRVCPCFVERLAARHILADLLIIEL